MNFFSDFSVNIFWEKKSEPAYSCAVGLIFLVSFVII